MERYKKHEFKEGLLKEALEDMPKMAKTPKTHKEIKNSISNKKFH